MEQPANSQNETLLDDKALPVGSAPEHPSENGESVALSRGRNWMKRVLSAVAIALLMTLSYAAGWRHSARPVTASASAGSRPRGPSALKPSTWDSANATPPSAEPIIAPTRSARDRTT